MDKLAESTRYNISKILREVNSIRNFGNGTAYNEYIDKVIQAILSDPNIVEISKGERAHILETQESLCRLGESVGDDGSCCICQSIKEKLEKK